MRLIGNTGNKIDWDSVVASLENITAEPNSFKHYLNDPAFQNLKKLWSQGPYIDGDVVEWENFYPEDHFDTNIVSVFSEIVNAKPWMVWISRIPPGKMAPWHYDASSKLDRLLELGKPVRFTCYITNPSDGHISVVNNTALHRPDKGSIYKWINYQDWHCGVNAGFVNKYQFNYWGYV